MSFGKRVVSETITVDAVLSENRLFGRRREAAAVKRSDGHEVSCLLLSAGGHWLMTSPMDH